MATQQVRPGQISSDTPDPLLLANGTATVPGFAFASNPNTGLLLNGTGQLGISINGSQRFGFDVNGLKLGSGEIMAWSATTAPFGTTDVGVAREGAGILAQRSGTTAQAFRLYNTFTDASNYERGSIRWNANLLIIGTESLGTGVARQMSLVSGAQMYFNTSGSDRWRIETAGHLVAVSDGVLDIGAAGANRPRNYFGSGSVTVGLGVAAGFNYAATNPMVSSSSGMWFPRMSDLTGGFWLDYLDDFAFVDKRVGAVTTITGAVAQSAGTVTDLFRDDSNSVVWNTGTSPFPIVIEIDTITTQIAPSGNGFYNLGLTFRSTGAGAKPTNVKIETWDTGAYVTKYDQAMPTDPIGGAWLSPRFAGDPVGGSGMKKLKITLSGTNPLAGTDVFRLQRVMLYHTTAQWDTWRLHKLGGTMHGKIDWSAGNGAIDHLLGPSDQPFVLRAGAGQEARIKDNAGTVRFALTSLGVNITGDAAVTGALSATGNVNFTGLPTVSPGVAGRLWNDAGTIKIS